jgi:hypothetical protein
MKQYLVAAIIVAAFATPALAADFYIAADLASGKSMVMASTPQFRAIQNN